MEYQERKAPIVFRTDGYGLFLLLHSQVSNVNLSFTHRVVLSRVVTNMNSHVIQQCFIGAYEVQIALLT